jgi:hypothetical protein
MFKPMLAKLLLLIRDSSMRLMWGVRTICQDNARRGTEKSKQICRDKGLAGPECAC